MPVGKDPAIRSVAGGPFLSCEKSGPPQEIFSLANALCAIAAAMTQAANVTSPRHLNFMIESSNALCFSDAALARIAKHR